MTPRDTTEMPAVVDERGSVRRSPTPTSLAVDEDEIAFWTDARVQEAVDEAVEEALDESAGGTIIAILVVGSTCFAIGIALGALVTVWVR